MKKTILLFMLAALLLLPACSDEPAATPTPFPPTTDAVSESTAVPTSTNPPPTTAPVTEPSPTATTEAPPPTEPPPPPPTSPPVESEGEARTTITAPAAGSTLVAGERIIVAGEVEPGDLTLDLTLTIGQYTVLATAVTPDETGNWSTELLLPPTTAGAALLQAVVNGVIQAEQPVTLTFAATDPAWITTDRPQQGDLAVSGYTFFFNGQANEPINEMITIGILAEQCTEFASRQSFMVPGGIWRGVLILPATLPAGTACAIAYTGDFPNGEWRGTITPIEIQPYADETPLLLLGNTSINFRAGSGTNLFGMAANAAGGEVTVQLINPVDDSVMTSGTAFTDSFGYWEIDLVLPAATLTGPAQLLISIGTGAEDGQEIRRDINIGP